MNDATRYTMELEPNCAYITIHVPLPDGTMHHVSKRVSGLDRGVEHDAHLVFGDLNPLLDSFQWCYDKASKKQQTGKS